MIAVRAPPGSTIEIPSEMQIKEKQALALKDRQEYVDRAGEIGSQGFERERSMMSCSVIWTRSTRYSLTPAEARGRESRYKSTTSATSVFPPSLAMRLSHLNFCSKIQPTTILCKGMNSHMATIRVSSSKIINSIMALKTTKWWHLTIALREDFFHHSLLQSEPLPITMSRGSHRS